MPPLYRNVNTTIWANPETSACQQTLETYEPHISKAEVSFTLSRQQHMFNDCKHPGVLNVNYINFNSFLSSLFSHLFAIILHEHVLLNTSNMVYFLLTISDNVNNNTTTIVIMMVAVYFTVSATRGQFIPIWKFRIHVFCTNIPLSCPLIPHVCFLFNNNRRQLTAHIFHSNPDHNATKYRLCPHITASESLSSGNESNKTSLITICQILKYLKSYPLV